MIEKTLILIKPDGVQRGLIGEILHRFERCGLKIIGLKLVYASKELAGKHYADDKEWLEAVGRKTLSAYEAKGEKINRTPLEQGQLVRQMLMEYIAMSPVVAVALEGHEAVAHVRKLVGDTAPGMAAPGTIRGDLAFETFRFADQLKRPVQNLIHASGTVDEAKRELDLWFTPEELHVWQRVDDVLFFRKGK